jgi:2-phosphosulfolactate phosphatase
MRVELEWGPVGAGVLAARCPVIVVCDVLSFSTTVTIAAAAGVRIRPHPWKDESAAALAARVDALLAGPRGSDISLSPVSMRGLARGSVVVLPSPNGAMCSLTAAEGGAMVIAGCLRNAAAVARWCEARGLDVGLVSAGEQWPDGTMRPAYEDWVGAGLIAAHLAAHAELSPEAGAAMLAAHQRQPLAGVASGAELTGAGFGEDVVIADEADVDDIVPMLVDGQFVAVDASV